MDNHYIKKFRFPVEISHVTPPGEYFVAVHLFAVGDTILEEDDLCCETVCGVAGLFHTLQIKSKDMSFAGVIRIAATSLCRAGMTGRVGSILSQFPIRCLSGSVWSTCGARSSTLLRPSCVNVTSNVRGVQTAGLHHRKDIQLK